MKNSLVKEAMLLQTGFSRRVKNTGKVPGTFFWGLSSAPKGTKIRDFTGPNYDKFVRKGK